MDKKMINMMRETSNIVVLTGAGISQESGIPTFRGEGGLWKKFRAEELATPQAFKKDPALVWEWYKFRQDKVSECKPNPGHHIISEMERFYSDFTLITQNVDGLHRKAGNTKILELHGNIWKMRCTADERVVDYFSCEGIPKCECGAIFRPHIVWFGESLDSNILEHAFKVSAESLVFIVVGTSGVVHPAAQLPIIAREKGAYLIEVNTERTPISSHSDCFLEGKSGELLPVLWDEIKQK